MTYQEQLDEVQAAITAILTRGQEVEWNGRRVKRADLAELRARETELVALIGRASRTSMRMRQAVPLD